MGKTIANCTKGRTSPFLLFPRRKLYLSIFALAELGEDAEVFERRGVAGDLAAAGDFLEQAAHDLSAARLGQRVGEADVIRLRDGSDHFTDMPAEDFLEIGVDDGVG